MTRGSGGFVDCGAGVRLERRVPCPMPDGVLLYADHYYPPDSKSKTHPTILMRQPYGSDIASTVVYAHPVWFARHGYNVVIQDVRGRGESEGEFYPFRHEGKDGAAAIASVRARPEANGRVGMYGFSYQGMTQLLAAAEQPKGLQCIAPAMTAHDLYEGWFYCNGAMRLASTLGWGLQMLKEDARRLGLRKASDLLEGAWASLPAQYLETPYGKHPAIHAQGLPSYARDWMEHDAPDSYWQRMDISKTLSKIRVPALHISGWYDTYLKGSIDGFRAMRANAGSAEARDQQYLVAGPWVHIPWSDRIGAHSFGEAATLDTDSLLLRWFNHWLKDTNEFSREPRIRHFALNDNSWHRAVDLPVPSHALYLKSFGRANSSKGDGVLTSAEPKSTEAPDVFVYDPEVPVIAPGGLKAAAGPANQAALESGNNLLVYTTSALTAPLHVFGSVEVALYATTSADTADMVVKLVCLRGIGEAQFVCIGIARSTYLFGSKYCGDEEYLWKFSLEPTSCVFAVGDRLRIEIASSAYPLYDRNPGNQIPARDADSWNWRRSTQTIFHDAGRPSMIRLPIAASNGSAMR